MRRVLASLLSLLLVGSPTPLFDGPNPGQKKAQAEEVAVQLVPHFKMVAPGTGFTVLEGPITKQSVQQTIVSMVGAAAVGGAKTMVLVINSEGGEYDAGFLLSRFLENFMVPTMCVVDGMAASMASYILQSCDARSMTKRSMLMIHEPSWSMEGGEQRFRNAAEALRALTSAMVEHYARRMGAPTLEVSRRIAGGREWWMDWKQSQQANMVDAVLNRKEEAFALMAQMAALLSRTPPAPTTK